MLNAGRSANASAFVAHTRFAMSLFHHAWHACACVACVCVRAMRVRAWPRACGGTSRLAADKFRFPMLLTSAHMIFGSVVLLPVMLLTDGYHARLLMRTIEKSAPTASPEYADVAQRVTLARVVKILPPRMRALALARQRFPLLLACE